jgi:hypothetical protein
MAVITMQALIKETFQVIQKANQARKQAVGEAAGDLIFSQVFSQDAILHPMSLRALQKAKFKSQYHSKEKGLGQWRRYSKHFCLGQWRR